RCVRLPALIVLLSSQPLAKFYPTAGLAPMLPQLRDRNIDIWALGFLELDNRKPIVLIGYKIFVLSVHQKSHACGRPIPEKSLAVNILFRYEPPIPRVRRTVTVVAHHKVTVALYLSRRPTRKRLVVLDVQIILDQFRAVDIHLSASHFDDLARKPNYALHVTLVRLFRVPKYDDVSPFKMAPSDSLNVVIDKLVDQ